jgi:3-methyl-2-oxobutanoate hydroxymethyltransferase
MDKVTVRTLQEMKAKGEKIVALTAYDAPTARLLNEAGVDVVLVGDSVANVKLGYENTLPVTLEEMIHHTRAAKRGNGRAMLVGDMPFLTYEYDPREAVRQVGRLVKTAGAEAVKVEGASPTILRSIRALIEANIPVMGHLGLTPQSIHRFGGHRVQGRGPKAAAALKADARALEKVGVFALVLEAIPARLAAALTGSLKIPTIGIGAGPRCDGQILVVDDLLGMTPPPRPKFVRPYAELRVEAVRAVRAWRDDVRRGRFPGPAESYD